jgi:membrane glycosyltransferase
MVWGILGSVICWLVAAHLLAWMSPVLAGLILAPAMALFTGGTAGTSLTSLLGTAHDRQPPALLARHRIAEEEWRNRKA